MLEIYKARENIDKEKFIYGKTSGETFVIVPDQYTLVAEEQALKYLGKACLFDVEIISMSTLGSRVLAEKGLENIPRLDKYGRHMLLSGLISEQSDEMEVFREASDKNSFVSMVNDFISDMKRQGCGTADLRRMVDEDILDPLLRKKLEELVAIIDRYEEAIEGKYTDAEDYIGFYTDAISDSEIISGKGIWIYGFDSMTPKFCDTVMALAGRADRVSIMLNLGDNGLEDIVEKMLISAAAERGIDTEICEIAAGADGPGLIDGTDYLLEKSETIERIEKYLFDPDVTKAAEENKDFIPEGLTIYECADRYAESELAAAYVTGLLRDEGYSMKDIVVIANDEDRMQPAVKRTFAEYGLPVFVDTRRGIADSKAAGFIVNQLEFLDKNYRTSSVMAAVKSGLTDLTPGEIENLENYVSAYHIKGNMWLSPFKYGEFEYGQEALAAIEESRRKLIEPLLRLKDMIAESGTVSGFADAFEAFLETEWNLNEKLETLAEAQSGAGYIEDAERTVQSYDACRDILRQVVAIMGDREMDLGVFLEMYIEGLENVDIGMIPPALDGLTLGTMIRTRPAPPKAVVILGANEGVLPLEPSAEGLFSVDEKKFFEKRDFPLGGLDDLKLLEENSAMYRMVSRPSAKLYISYSMSDGAGGSLKPSVLIEQIKAVFPNAVVTRDPEGYSVGDISSKDEAIRHLLNHIKDRNAGKKQSGDDVAAAVMDWLSGNDSGRLGTLIEAGQNENYAAPIDKGLVDRLFTSSRGGFSFSASRLENYFHCPFKHFVSYGLNPVEQREYRSGPRDIGDMYHECIMKVSEKVLKGDIPLPADEKVIGKAVEKELERMSSEYRGGLFSSNGREEYRFSRIKDICVEAMMAVAEQIEQGKITGAAFEEGFGRGRRFEPIEFEVDGKKVYIEGRIDRIDILAGDRIRIIDYKTGADEFDMEQMRQGYKMQLMVYLQGATGGKYEPAGMFYFKIKDSMIALNGTGSAEKQQAALDKESEGRFKLEGAYISEGEIIDAMPESVLDKKSKALEREEFVTLEKDVRKAIENISAGIIRGEIPIQPAKPRQDEYCKECKYCEYGAICKFDLSFGGNRYRNV